jgi:acetylornithine deacetylase
MQLDPRGEFRSAFDVSKSISCGEEMRPIPGTNGFRMMSSSEAEIIRRAVADVIDEAVERLRAGVRMASINPSVEDGGGEGAFQQFVAAELDSLGCRVESWETDADALAAWYPDIRGALRPEGFRGRPNVIGWIPSAERPDGQRAAVILNSHADTVAPGDTAAWKHPPFSAHLEQGTIYGLGVADAKGSLFTFIGAVRALRRAGIRLRRGAMIQSVVDEEWGGAGALECLRRGYTAGAALIGEPTELRVCPGSRGAMNLRIRVSGRKAHPGEGWRGVNAIRKTWLYIDALDRLRDDLDRTKMHPLWAPLKVGHVWNLMGLSGGPVGRVGRSVPDACEVTIGIGMIGTERRETMQPIIEAALRRVTADDAWLSAHPPEITWLPGGFDPAVADAAHPAVTALAHSLADLDHPATIEALSAATDGRHLVNAGGVPAVNFGPGEMHLAHSPMESLRVADFQKGIEAVALFLTRYCGGES